MTKSELALRLQRHFRAQANDLVSDDYYDAIADAEAELGWSLPQTDTFKVRWLRIRSTRHLLYFLLTGSARKFRFEGAHLHHRFKHYNTIVETMDKEFKTEIEENAHLFEGVDAHFMFGSKIDAGFSSNELGEDTTYNDDNEVIVEPDSTT